MEGENLNQMEIKGSSFLGSAKVSMWMSAKKYIYSLGPFSLIVQLHISHRHRVTGIHIAHSSPQVHRNGLNDTKLIPIYQGFTDLQWLDYFLRGVDLWLVQGLLSALTFTPGLLYSVCSVHIVTNSPLLGPTI